MTRHDRVEHAVDRVERAGELMADKLLEVKPKLRGWLHAGTAPLALAAGIVLVALSPTASTRIGSTAFALSALLVFTVSAILSDMSSTACSIRSTAWSTRSRWVIGWAPYIPKYRSRGESRTPSTH